MRKFIPALRLLVLMICGSASVTASNHETHERIKRDFQQILGDATKFPYVLVQLTTEYLRRSLPFDMQRDFKLPHPASYLSISPDKTALVVFRTHYQQNERDAMTSVFDISGKLRFTLPGVKFLAWGVNEDILTTHKDGNEYVLDSRNAQTGAFLRRMMRKGSPIGSVAVSNDGTKVACGTLTGTELGQLEIWRLKGENSGDYSRITVRNPEKISWSTKGDKLIVHEAMKGFSIYNEYGTRIYTDQTPYEDVSWSPKNNDVLAAQYANRKEIRLYDSARGERTDIVHGIAGHRKLSWSPQGSALVACGWGPNVSAIDVTRKEQAMSLPQESYFGIDDVSYAGEDTLMSFKKKYRDELTGETDCYIQIWKRSFPYDIRVAVEAPSSRKRKLSSASDSHHRK